MKKKKNSIKFKIYIYIGVTVLLAALAVALITFYISISSIDRYYETLSKDTASNFSTMIDGDYLERLKRHVESREYQKLRTIAEESENEDLIETDLKNAGLWEEYDSVRKKIDLYLSNMEDVKYIYIVVCGDVDAEQDMYLLNDSEDPLYITGYFEDREDAFAGMDIAKGTEPTVSYGWLCSSFVPVYSSEGNIVCQVGCDVEMNDIMTERIKSFVSMIISAVIVTAVIVVGVIFLIKKIVVTPLNRVKDEMEKFSPSEDLSYEKSGVMNLEFESRDEISDIHDGIRAMQIRILDYLKDITIIRKEKDKAVSDAAEKSKEINQISIEAYKDALTNVGSKTAYNKVTKEINIEIENDEAEFAVVMIDINLLKQVNDNYGHSAGDDYIRGCSKIICRAFKRSPVYRIGGDEFAVILQGEDYDNRDEKVSAVTQAFEDSYAQVDQEPWKRYSAAVGMAVYEGGDPDVETVLRRADSAMYEAKVEFKKKNGIGSPR